MKEISFLLCVFLTLLELKSQSQEYHMQQQDDTFYDFVNFWYDTTNYNFSDTAEGGKNSNADRLRTIWLPRLSPSGDVGNAAEQFIDYSRNYSTIQSNYNPHWICLGPADFPLVGGKGIGRMHRIEFDPFYNGNNNRVIYSSSGFGGLWRTYDNGALWHNVNTDLQLPTTSVGDIAIDPNSSDTIFITTGLCDEGIKIYEVNTGKINPIFTSGVFRSDDYGSTWKNVSEDMLYDFVHGGTLRRIKINPTNSSQIFVVGTTGIYKTSNGLSSQPDWDLVLDASNIQDDQLYGLEFKPVSPYNTIIASGKDIYVSTDQGFNWNTITGPSTGLDFDSIQDNFIVDRINIAVTIANPNKIFAYIVGEEDYWDGPCLKQRMRLYIYIYDFSQNHWDQDFSFTDKTTNNNCDNQPVEYNLRQAISWDRLAIVASPQNEYEYFFGTTNLWGTKDYRIKDPERWSTYLKYNFHPDIHGLEYNPIDTSIIYCANDGGIGKKDLNDSIIDQGWDYLYNGLEIATIWAFDHSEFNSDWIGMGLQDDATLFQNEDDGNLFWIAKGGGDGYSLQNYKLYPEIFYYAPNNSIEFYDYLNPSSSSWELVPMDNIAQTYSDIIKGCKIIQHPQKDSLIKGFNQLYKREKKSNPGYNDWSVESDIAKYDTTLWPKWKRQIIDFEISPSDPEYIYIVTLGIYNGEGEWALPSHLFMSSTGMNNGDWDEDHFEEIEFPGNGINPFPVITALEVSPTNPRKIWITFSGFVQEYKVWSYDGTTNTWINEDPNDSLNNLPVNDIVYQPGTNDRLYIATDAGVYVKDNSMSEWTKYGDFPNVRVTELKINYCSNKLRAATFGRGLWEGDLLASSGYDNERIISEDIIWDEIQALTKDLRITNTGKLTIANTVSMPYLSKIIVERGGELVIDGGKITNNCGKMWQGIEVWGDTTAAQSTSGAQGKIIIENGGVIENAITAVQLGRIDSSGYGGGIIQTGDAHFINNRTGIRFYPYKNIVSGVEIDNLSYFNNTEFLTNTELADESIPENFIYLDNVKGIVVQGCTFTNSRPEEEASMSYRGVGIYGEDADFTISDSSSFTKLNYGIQAFDLVSTKNFKVINSAFINNMTGIYSKGIDNSNIIFNDFDIYYISIFHGPDDIFGGLYLDNCTGYTVEENNFYNEDNYPYPDEIISIGITVNNSEDNLNMIYRNTFDNLHMGILAQNRNRGAYNSTGLKLKCNICTDNRGDFAVTADTASANKGISIHQGAYIYGDKTAPAGNLFSHANNNNPNSDFNNTLSRQWIYYFHHYGNSQNPWVPVYYQNITPVPYINPDDFDKVCPPNFSFGGGLLKSEAIVMDEEELIARMSLMENLRDSTANILSLWIDAGNTPELNYEVEFSTPEESLEMYDELIAYSPYLSDTVLSTSIEKEDVLINAMIRDVMVANPHGAKKEELIEALEQRVPPLPEYMMAEIMAGLDSIALKEQRESEVAWYEQERAIAFNKLMKIYLAEDYSTSAEESIISLITDHGNLNDNYYLANRCLEQGNISNAFTILTNLPNQFVMDSEQEIEHQDYLTLFTMVSNIMQQSNPMDSLDNTSRQVLYQMAEHDSRPAIMAQNILQHIDTASYPEVYILPTSGPVLRKYEAENPEIISGTDKGTVFRIYPNPSHEYFIIEYYFEVIPRNASFSINDPLGRIIEEGLIGGQQNQLIRRTTSYSSGIYTIKLIINGKVENALKLNVIK